MKHRAVFFVFLALLAGCSALEPKDAKDIKRAGGPLEPAVMQKFVDVPVPAKFQLKGEDSYSFESAGMRVGVLRYVGRADPEQVVNFYKEQMPMYNWNLLNVVEYGNRMMNFDRENETCIISIETKGKHVTITASLGPKSQAPGKKSKQPLK